MQGRRSILPLEVWIHLWSGGEEALSAAARAPERVDAVALTLAVLGAGSSQTPSASVSSLSADEKKFLKEAVEDMGCPPAELSPRGSFDVIQGPSDYAMDRCDLASADLILMSLPRVGFEPRPMAELLPGGQAEVDSTIKSILVPPEVQQRQFEETGLSKPYTDPALRSRKAHVRLVRRLMESSIVELSLEDGTRIGLFSVHKSDGVHQRLIIDARIRNTHFTELVGGRPPDCAEFLPDPNK